MNILVLVKQVPDASADRRFRPDGTVDRVEVDALLCELDEYAVEQALRITEQRKGEDHHVTAVSVGPDRAIDAVRKALQMGADKGVLVSGAAIAGSDAVATSLILAAAVRKLDESTKVDLVVCGLASTDGSMGVVPSMLAERLGWPQVTLATALETRGDEVRARRDGDVTTDVIGGSMPLVLSITDQSGEARYPSFKGIMAAKKKPLDVLTLADLGVGPQHVGLDAAWSEVIETEERPPRAAGQIISDESKQAAAALYAFLAARGLVRE